MFLQELLDTGFNTQLCSGLFTRTAHSLDGTETRLLDRRLGFWAANKIIIATPQNCLTQPPDFSYHMAPTHATKNLNC